MTLEVGRFYIMLDSPAVHSWFPLGIAVRAYTRSKGFRFLLALALVRLEVGLTPDFNEEFGYAGLIDDTAS